MDNKVYVLPHTNKNWYCCHPLQTPFCMSDGKTSRDPPMCGAAHKRPIFEDYFRPWIANWLRAHA